MKRGMKSLVIGVVMLMFLTAFVPVATAEEPPDETPVDDNDNETEDANGILWCIFHPVDCLESLIPLIKIGMEG
jgi:hypothetical protein